MSRVIQNESVRLGGGDKSNTYIVVTKELTLTMVAGATASGSVTFPQGTHFWEGTLFETATAFTGSPTNINARIGTAAAGAQVVADTDVKAQGHTNGTTVSTFDSLGYAANGPVTLYAQIAAVGGTSPAGSVTIVFKYRVPLL